MGEQVSDTFPYQGIRSKLGGAADWYARFNRSDRDDLLQEGLVRAWQTWQRKPDVGYALRSAKRQMAAVASGERPMLTDTPRSRGVPKGPYRMNMVASIHSETLGDREPAHDPYGAADSLAVLDRAVRQLSSDERAIAAGYAVRDTWVEVGRDLGITKDAARLRWSRQVLPKMRAALGVEV